MKIRKVVLFILGIAFAIMLLTGCSAADSDQVASAAESGSSDSVTAVVDVIDSDSSDFDMIDPGTADAGTIEPASSDSDAVESGSSDTIIVDSDISDASGEGSIVYAEDGFGEGGFGDIMHTNFFEYSVNSAYTCSSYEGYTPDAGNQLLVAEITVKNIFDENIEMYDQDFQVQWSDTGDDAYGWPITLYMEEGAVLGDSMLPGTYELNKQESRTGNLVYEVPEGEREFSISYLTYYDDERQGDVFFVYFAADQN